MKSNPQRDEWLQQRLLELVKTLGNGSADALGRELGYTNGGYIREVLAGKKPVRGAIIDRTHQLQGYERWFDADPTQKLEKTLQQGLPERSMIVATPATTGGGATTVPSLLSEDDDVVIPLSSAIGSMGFGAVMAEEEVITHMTVNRSWLNRHANFTAAENLALLAGYGDSMSGTFEHGDVLLVDRGVAEVKVDAVYVLSLNDELYVKRLQRRPNGEVLMISDNPKYETYTIQNGERERFKVLGRVVMIWNAKRL